MSTIIWIGLVVIGSTVTLVLVSYVVEALRRKPRTPTKLSWAPDIPIRYVDANGNKIRYIKTGEGPNLLLLHTLRTQLDFFVKVVPELSQEFTVYALDYPGHGFSDIPDAPYDAEFFVSSVETFLEELDLRDVTLAGVSIGGAVASIIAARHDPRVARVVSINPYDYAKGRGMARSSALGKLLMTVNDVPVLGETFMRLRNFVIMKKVLEGGVYDPSSIPPRLLKEMYQVGNRPGHYRGFINLMRNAESWETATKKYNDINIPVLMVWGNEDWSTPEERKRDGELVPGAQMVTVEKGGHFLPLDAPQAVIDQIRRFQATAVD